MVCRSLLAVFGPHPLADAVREALVARLSADDLLERNLLPQCFERSSDDRQAGKAAARMARLFVEAGRPELAAVFYRQLAGRFCAVGMPRRKNRPTTCGRARRRRSDS